MRWGAVKRANGGLRRGLRATGYGGARGPPARPHSPQIGGPSPPQLLNFHPESSMTSARVINSYQYLMNGTTPSVARPLVPSSASFFGNCSAASLKRVYTPCLSHIALGHHSASGASTGEFRLCFLIKSQRFQPHFPYRRRDIHSIYRSLLKHSRAIPTRSIGLVYYREKH